MTRHECLVIGGGPAGLTAAMYLRRFHRDVVVLDAGASRARWIPKSNNCPGFPTGISGNDLLATLREQATRFDLDIVPARVVSLVGEGEGFTAVAEDGRRWQADAVILATGIIDVLPDVPWAETAVSTTALRLCAICDGYEASDGRLAVYGPFSESLSHARFLRTFSDSITLVGSDGSVPDDAVRREAAAAGIALLSGHVTLQFDGERCSACVDGERHDFDAVYPALGSEAQSGLAATLGARVDEKGELVVDAHKQTSVAGLYAIGDVVSALNQISVATGHAAVAATAVHNALPGKPRDARHPAPAAPAADAPLGADTPGDAAAARLGAARPHAA
ncbi:MAG TPA: NAD(P)/FAD-dependent oxidoreductase [Luteimonas sp.]|nr:NAD(P)/FAD-dependent oxidoreductase [Luteimonas sp.]